MKRFLPFLFILPFLLSTTNNDWKSKVDDSVLQQIVDGQRIDCLVTFRDQADLSKADLFQDKSDKGKYVFRQLTKTADRSQEKAISIIEIQTTTYQSFWIANVIRVDADLNLVRRLASLPEVKSIDPNPVVKQDLPEEESTASLRGPQAIEWGITNIGADQVWGMGYTGQGVVIAGQDTGVEWDHPAIQSQYRGWNGSSADHNYNWHDAITVADTSNPCGTNLIVPCDDESHGTHTIGTMVGDDGVGNQIGVAPGAKWMACRNMNQGNGTPSTYIDCFQFFLAPTDLNGANADPTKAPHVINNSWSCPSSEGCNSSNWSTMEQVINNLRAAGIVVVVSAGNGGRAGCNTVNAAPAIFDGSFAVGATTSSNNIRDFSSRGPVTVDGSNRLKPAISAPGSGVRSCVLNDGYALKSGTSMAGPHVAGLVALMIEANPSLSGDVAAIESTIISTPLARTTTQDCGGSGSNIPNNVYGYGIIDAFAAVNAVLALPVELIDFKAIVKNNLVKLNWETAQEINHDYFEVERSQDLENWEIVGRVNEPEYNNQDLKRYQLVDVNAKMGINYYRLRQVDLDGSFEYSKVVTADLTDPKTRTFKVYPNPATDQLFIELDGDKHQNIGITVYNSGGQLIEMFQNIDTTSSMFQLSVANWPEGIYFVAIRDELGSVLGQQTVVVR